MKREALNMAGTMTGDLIETEERWGLRPEADQRDASSSQGMLAAMRN